jgi:hypothetical protein
VDIPSFCDAVTGIAFPDIHPPLRHNWQAALDFNTLNPISTSGTPAYGAITYSTPGHRNLYEYNWTDAAPRVGFAYAAMPKLVIRGGFGLYYSRNFLPYGSIPAPGFSSSTTWTATAPNGVQVQTQLENAFATDSDILPITGNALQGLTDVGQAGGGINAVRRDPRVKQYVFGAQYAFTPNDLLDVNYVGNLGTRILLGGMNYGQLNPTHLALGETALTAEVTNPFSGTLSSLGLPAMACQNTDGSLAAGQMLEPYPEFCGGAVAQQEPVGMEASGAAGTRRTGQMGPGIDRTAEDCRTGSRQGGTGYRPTQAVRGSHPVADLW